jgi:hypothetical protein
MNTNNHITPFWRYGLLIVLLMLTTCVSATAEGPARMAVKGVDGKTYRPLDIRSKKAAVLFFIAHDCPIANSYAPEIGRICRQFEPQGFAFYTVYVEQDLPAAAARAHARAFRLTCPGLLDPQHRLVKFAGATITPEAAVISPEGKVLYHGRIDNLWASISVRRAMPTTHELKDALNAIARHAPVAHVSAPSVGCFIPTLS